MGWKIEQSLERLPSTRCRLGKCTPLPPTPRASQACLNVLAREYLILLFFLRAFMRAFCNVQRLRHGGGGGHQVYRWNCRER